MFVTLNMAVLYVDITCVAIDELLTAVVLGITVGMLLSDFEIC